jgi:hypothetical protein
LVGWLSRCPYETHVLTQHAGLPEAEAASAWPIGSVNRMNLVIEMCSYSYLFVQNYLRASRVYVPQGGA